MKSDEDDGTVFSGTRASFSMPAMRARSSEEETNLLNASCSSWEAKMKVSEVWYQRIEERNRPDMPDCIVGVLTCFHC